MTLCLLLFSLLAASWKNKPASDWTEADARRVLTDSPWVRTVTAGVTRAQTEQQRREGGNMGRPHGVGDAGAPVTLRLRWESALPVRVAELKAREIEPPTLEGEGYEIAVYGIPLAFVEGDPRSLGDPLKKLASLKREGKKDVKPSRVEVFQRADGMVVVYLFPLSAGISANDTALDFEAAIGRIVVKQSFDPRQMSFEGRLQL